MNRKLISALATVVLIGSAGAEAAQNTVAGQVYIVTAGQQIVRLPLVRIRVLAEQEVASFIAVKAEYINKKREALTSDINAKRGEIKALEKEISADVNELAALRKQWYDRIADCNLMSDGRETEICRKAADLAELGSRVRALDVKLGPSLNEIKERKQGLLKGWLAYKAGADPISFYRGIVGAPLEHLSETTSDVEGKYRLSIPKGKRVVIVAEADRAVMGQQEHYIWVLNYDPKKAANKAGTQDLANNNLIETGCNDCVPFSRYLQSYIDLLDPPL